jgi:hypothetical protein
MHKHAPEFSVDGLLKQRRQCVFGHFSLESKALEFGKERAELLIGLAEAEQFTSGIVHTVRVTEGSV